MPLLSLHLPLVDVSGNDRRSCEGASPLWPRALAILLLFVLVPTAARAGSQPPATIAIERWNEPVNTEATPISAAGDVSGTALPSNQTDLQIIRLAMAGNPWVEVAGTIAWQDFHVVSSPGLAGPVVAVTLAGEEESEVVILSRDDGHEVGRTRFAGAAQAGASLGRSHLAHVVRQSTGTWTLVLTQHSTKRAFQVQLPDQVTSTWSNWTLTSIGEGDVKWRAQDGTGAWWQLTLAANRSPSLLRTADYATLGVYLLGMLGLGLACARRVKKGGDMLLGGGRVPGWASGVSIVLTNLSAISFIALPSRAFVLDSTFLLFFAFGPWVAAPIVLFVIRPALQRGKFLTAYEILGSIFGRPFRKLGAWFYLIYELGRTGVLLVAPSLVIAMITGVPVIVCVLVVAIVTTIYTSVGGYEAVVWSDVAQAAVMLFALLFVPLWVIWQMGDLASAFGIAHEAGRFRLVNPSPSLSIEGWLVLIIYFLSSANSFLWHQPTVQRLLAARDERTFRTTLAASLACGPLLLGLLFLAGALLFSFYSVFPERMAVAVVNRDEIFASFLVRELPPGIVGLALAAILAASMSSLSSGLNSICSVIVGDLVPDSHRDRLIRSTGFNSLVTAGCGVVGVTIAVAVTASNAASLFDAFIAFTNLIAGSIGGVFILALIRGPYRPLDAALGFFAAVAAVLFVQTNTPFSFMVFGTIGMTACVAVASASAALRRLRIGHRQAM